MSPSHRPSCRWGRGRAGAGTGLGAVADGRAGLGAHAGTPRRCRTCRAGCQRGTRRGRCWGGRGSSSSSARRPPRGRARTRRMVGPATTCSTADRSCSLRKAARSGSGSTAEGATSGGGGAGGWCRAGFRAQDPGRETVEEAAACPGAAALSAPPRCGAALTRPWRPGSACAARCLRASGEVPRPRLGAGGSAAASHVTRKATNGPRPAALRARRLWGRPALPSPHLPRVEARGLLLLVSGSQGLPRRRISVPGGGLPARRVTRATSAAHGPRTRSSGPAPGAPRLPASAQAAGPGPPPSCGTDGWRLWQME